MTQRTDERPFSIQEFAENPEPRLPCLLLLDTSTSMAGDPIMKLTTSLTVFKDALVGDSLAAKRVEVGLVTYGSTITCLDFQTADVLQPPFLHAGGNPYMGAAIEQGLDMLERRKSMYRQNGISYYRAWVFLLANSAPTDHWRVASRRVRTGETNRSFTFFAVNIGNANMNVLSQISTHPPLQLDELSVRDHFTWLSNSLSSISHSLPGDTTSAGWATTA